MDGSHKRILSLSLRYGGIDGHCGRLGVAQWVRALDALHARRQRLHRGAESQRRPATGRRGRRELRRRRLEPGMLYDRSTANVPDSARHRSVTTFRLVHRESNLMFTVSSDKNQRKIRFHINFRNFEYTRVSFESFFLECYVREISWFSSSTWWKSDCFCACNSAKCNVIIWRHMIREIGNYCFIFQRNLDVKLRWPPNGSSTWVSKVPWYLILVPWQCLIVT